MFDGRIYRAALLPLLPALAIAGFSLGGRAAPLASSLAPGAFDGGRAFSELQTMVRRYPERPPGGSADNELAAEIAQTLRGLGGSGTVGFQISVRRTAARTIDGSRMLTTVIAERPGSSGEPPIAIVAHRDAAGAGATAELSGTAALVELARVFAQSETHRTIVLVSTSGGSGGYAGAADFARRPGTAPDAAIVLGDLAGTRARPPFVLPWSGGSAAAPEALQATLDSAISGQVGLAPGTPSAMAQLVHLALPLASGEEAPLDAAGIPAVLVQASGERAPANGEAVSEASLQSFGSAVLSAVYALDEGPALAAPAAPRLVLGHNTLPGWAIALLALALLLAPLLTCVDALARLRRRREPIAGALTWTFAAALPFCAAALFARALGGLGIVASPGSQLSSGALSADDSAAIATVLTALALALMLALLAWPRAARGVGLPALPTGDAARLAPLLVLLAVALVAWAFDPFACLLAVPALHLWLVAGGERAGRGRVLALAAALAGLLPLALLATVYTHELGLGPGGLAQSVVLALASGQVGVLGALLWSAALGCALAILAAVLAPAPRPAREPREELQVSTRGPLSYAGPGSLGGTESALQR